MHVSLAPEYLFSLFGLKISNTILTAWLVMVILVVVAIFIRTTLKQVPGKFQSVIELVYLYFLDSSEKVLGRRDVAKEIFPYVMTLFLFILVCNWTELLPGNHTFGLNVLDSHGEHELVSFLRPPSTDLNLVMAMALVSVGYVQYIGLKFGGTGYLKKFFNFSSPVMFFVGLLELFSEIARVVSFTFRLFGNIFAGMVLLGVMFYLTLELLPFFPILPLPFYILEILVGAIQAFVFSFLVIVLSSVAVAGHGEH